MTDLLRSPGQMSTVAGAGSQEVQIIYEDSVPDHWFDYRPLRVVNIYVYSAAGKLS